MKKNSAYTDKTKKTSVSIGKYYQNIINQEISSGRYRSVSEVMRAGLLLLENNNKTNKKTV